MIIPSNLFPTWTNHDILDGNTYTEQRFKLWLANKSVALWPQVFSWMVVNIYPADPKVDYRFDSDFANKAILVTFNWDSSGRGCNNSSCYRTYPKGRMCTHHDPPIIFPSGEQTDIVACQPACYMKQRLQNLRKRLPSDLALFDKEDPRRCVECAYLPANITHFTRIRRLDGRYELYDSRDKSRHIEANGAHDIGTPVQQNKDQHLQTDSETPFLVWDAELNQCILPNEFAFQQVVEPWWRDPSHSVCRVTNFRHGNDPVWGYRPKYLGQQDPKDYAFLVRHSHTYCRAFAKNWNSAEGSCEETLLNTILNYTLAGDAMQRWIRQVIDGDWGCAEDKWVPIEGERHREVDPTKATSANHYVTWRGDINVTGFKLPPPNVQFSDLGIDVRLTGNRLYWNSHEGIISHLPLFNLVESYGSEHRDPAADLARKTRIKRSAPPPANYHNYNSLFYKNRLANSTSPVENRPRRPPARQPDHPQDDKPVNDDDVDEAFRHLEQALRKKRAILETRLREKPDSRYVLRSDDRDRQLDLNLRSQLQKLRHRRVKRTADSQAEEETDSQLHSNSTSVTYSQNLPEYVAQQYLKFYLRDDKIPPTEIDIPNDPPLTADERQSRPSRAAKTPEARTLTPASMKTDHTINQIIKHINETGNRSEFWQAMKGLGIGVSVGVGEVLLNKSLRYGYKKILQFMSRKSSGLISQSLMKAGLRVAQARIAGIVVARFTTRALISIGAISSGVGAIIGAVQLMSLVFDIAGLAGWDPGNYNSETDLAVYRDIADFFNYTKQSTSRGPVTPFEMMMMLNSVTPSLDNNDDSSTVPVPPMSMNRHCYHHCPRPLKIPQQSKAAQSQDGNMKKIPPSTSTSA